MMTALAPHMREKSNRLMPLATELQALVVLQRNLVVARDVLRETDALATKNKVDLAHPLVTCAIAWLYGSRPARGVLKPTVNPTEEGAYNGVADIRLVMEMAHVCNMWNERRSRQSVCLLTGDKNPAALDMVLKVRVDTTFAAGVNGPEIVSFNSTLSQELLPSLAKDEGEMNRVIERLRTSRDDNTGKVIHP